jgi:mannose/cellobiose epimerase-like protein (N-acyl-D-glucosamine 2-epimerase family)
MNPDFRSPETLIAHIRHTLAFYAPRCVDPSGGFHHFFKDDGSVYNHTRRHLVSSTRFVFNYAMAFRQFGDHADRERMLHGVRFLRDAHRDPATGGYAWELDWTGGQKRVIDDTNHCYGLAFVLLAYSQALLAGHQEAAPWIDETFDLMEARFWEPQHGLYADEASGDWSRLSGYRGQNANMHACESLITAFEATANPRYLKRAATLACNITVRQAGLADGLVWEHFRSDWSIDPDYNRHDKTNIFRPWGYQPGHLAEWAKLLLILERHGKALDEPTGWMLPLARKLFDAALEHAWDTRYGGIHYGFGPDGKICDADKYFWVQAESLPPLACWLPAPATKNIGRGTTGSGRTAGSISWTTVTAPGTASLTNETKRSRTRKAPLGRPTTTPWAPATSCSTSCRPRRESR